MTTNEEQNYEQIIEIERRGDSFSMAEEAALKYRRKFLTAKSSDMYVVLAEWRKPIRVNRVVMLRQFFSSR